MVPVAERGGEVDNAGAATVDDDDVADDGVCVAVTVGLDASRQWLCEQSDKIYGWKKQYFTCFCNCRRVRCERREKMR